MMHPRKGEFFSSRVCYISLNQIRPRGTRYQLSGSFSAPTPMAHTAPMAVTATERTVRGRI